MDLGGGGMKHSHSPSLVREGSRPVSVSAADKRPDGLWRMVPSGADSPKEAPCHKHGGNLKATRTGNCSVTLEAENLTKKGSREVWWLPQWDDQELEAHRNSILPLSTAALPERPSGSRNSTLRRPLSVSPSRRYQQVASNGDLHVSRAKTPSQRSRMPPCEALSPPARMRARIPRSFEARAEAEASECSTVMRGEPVKVGSSNSLFPDSPGLKKTHGAPHLQQRRTWRLLRHLVDELEYAQKGRPTKPHSQALVQQPATLRHLLQPLMPLLPLRRILDQLIGQGQSNDNEARTSSRGSPKLAQKWSSGLRPRSALQQNTPSNYRSMGYPSTCGSILSSQQCSSPSPSRPRSAVAGRALQMRSSSLPAGDKGPMVKLAKPTLGFRTASRTTTDERRRGRVSPTRGLAVRHLHSDSGAWQMGQPELQQFSGPRVARPLSAGRHQQVKYQVASRLPPGALEHRRSPTACNRAGSIGRGPKVTLIRSWENSETCGLPLMTEPLCSPRSADSGDTVKAGAVFPSRSMTLDCDDDRGSRCGCYPCRKDRLSNSQRFTSTRVLGTLPPSSSASDVNDDLTPHSVPSLQQDSSASIDARPYTEAEGDPSGASRMHPRPGPRSFGLRLAEPRPSPPRRQTVASPSLLGCVAEGDKPSRRPQHSQEGPLTSPSKKERRLTVSEAMKRRGMAMTGKAGPVAHEREESDKESPKSQTSLHMPRHKEAPKAREGKRTTTPRSGPSLSPIRPPAAKSKLERLPAQGKALGRKDSKASVKSPRGSTLELVPSNIGGRRLSAPPPRRLTQARVAPTTPPRTRIGISSTATARFGSLSLKASLTRRKTVKISSAKAKAKDTELVEDEEPPLKSMLEPEPEKADDKVEGTPAPEEPPPEPLYPYLTLAELPVLETPVRPLPNLSAIPLQATTDPPPTVDDSVTFMHVLGRSERLTEEARDKATKTVVSNLCNDAPGTMLLIARWMDSAADTVASNSAAVKDELPWRDVVPPLFVGPSLHRQLLSPRMPGTIPELGDLREFLETEGFVETEEQKLRQLLASKSLSTQISRSPEEGAKEQKGPSPLDNHLDYVLAVAIAHLRLRQQPLVLSKITRYVVGAGAGDESGSTSCCTDSRCTSHRSNDSADVDDGADTECGGVVRGALRLPFTENSGSQRRCWSCLPIRRPARTCFCESSQGFLRTDREVIHSTMYSCCCFPSAHRLPELDLFESMAAQQVRSAVRRMPLLPSEKYLRYLRLLGRKRELEALAKWLAGRPDVIPPYSEHKAFKEKHNTAEIPKSHSTEPEDPIRSYSGSSHGSEASNESIGHLASDDSLDGLDGKDQATAQEEKRRLTTDEGIKAQGESQGEKEGGSDCSSFGVSLHSGLASPSDQGPGNLCPSPLPLNCEGTELSHVSAEDRRQAKGPDQSCEVSVTKRQQNLRASAKMPTAGSSTKYQLPNNLPLSGIANVKSWSKPAESYHTKQGADTGPAHTTHLRGAAVAGVVAKSRAGRQPIAKGSTSQICATNSRIVYGRKHGRVPTSAQWQPPTTLGRSAGAQDTKRAVRTPFPKARDFPVDQTADGEPSEPEGVTDISLGSSKPSLLDAAATQGTQEANLQVSRRKASPYPPQRRASTSSGQQNARLQISTERLIAHSKMSEQRGSFSMSSHPQQSFPRRPTSALLSKRGAGSRSKGSNAVPDKNTGRLTREAMDLLTEPQMLAEVASLCARLTALNCCRSEVPVVEGERPAAFPPDIDEPTGTTEDLMCQLQSES